MSGTNYYTLIDDNVYAYEIDDVGRVLRGKFDTFATPPTTSKRYEKGCEMTKTDAVNGVGAIYQNTGTFISPAWTLMPLSGGSGSPSAPFNSVQFNNGGVFGGDASLTFDNAAQTLTFNGSGNGTLLNIIDPLQLIQLEAFTAGVGTQLQLTQSGAQLRYNNGFTWGFQATNTGGGQTEIVANGNVWIWPNTIGAAGTVLTDAAGNGTLSWTAPVTNISIGDSITGGTSGRVLFENAGPVLADSGQFTFDSGSNNFTVGDSARAQLVVNAGGQFMTMGTNDWSVNDVTSNGVIVANTVSKVVRIGDVSSVGNDTLLTIDDGAKIIDLGPGGGTTTHIHLAQSNASLIFTSGGTPWGFNVNSGGGGTTEIIANNNAWKWPNAFGAAGSVLTDAAGNGTMSWAVPSGLSSTLASADIFVGNAGNVATGVAMTGNVSIDNTGATTIGSINLETANVINILSTEIPIGTAAGTVVFSSLSGDVTMANNGAVTLADSVKVYTTKVSLTSGDILTLGSVPVELVPTPGAGKTIEILGIAVRINYNTTPYATHTTMVVYHDVSSTEYSNASTLLDTSVTVRRFNLSASSALMSENTAVTLSVTGGDPTAGDSSIDVYTTYKIITL